MQDMEMKKNAISIDRLDKQLTQKKRMKDSTVDLITT